MTPEEQFVLDYFDAAYEALRVFDIEKLEALALESSFPCGLDGFIGRRWLSHAVEGGNLKSIAWVIAQGSVVNYLDDEGYTVLFTALDLEKNLPLAEAEVTQAEATSRTIEIIDILLEAGADLSLEDCIGVTALHHAAIHSSLPIVKHLVELGADIFSYDRDMFPQRALEKAMRMKKHDVVEYLRSAMQTRSKEP